MKNITLLLLAVPLLLVGCTKDPQSDFVVSSSTVGIWEDVYFTNRSIDAESFEWDFGDGFVSNSFNATHNYDMDGIYRVSLKAYYKGRVNISYLNVTVVDASIEITVEEYYDPFVVPQARVRLYPTLYDWEHETHLTAEGTTDDAGYVRFDHLAAQRYFVDVWGPYHDNLQLASEDVNFITTPPLIIGTLVNFTALVDYYPNGKKASSINMERQVNVPGLTPRGLPVR